MRHRPLLALPALFAALSASAVRIAPPRVALAPAAARMSPAALAPSALSAAAVSGAAAAGATMSREIPLGGGRSLTVSAGSWEEARMDMNSILARISAAQARVVQSYEYKETALGVRNVQFKFTPDSFEGAEQIIQDVLQYQADLARLIDALEGYEKAHGRGETQIKEGLNWARGRHAAITRNLSDSKLAGALSGIGRWESAERNSLGRALMGPYVAMFDKGPLRETTGQRTRLELQLWTSPAAIAAEAEHRRREPNIRLRASTLAAMVEAAGRTGP